VIVTETDQPVGSDDVGLDATVDRLVASPVFILTSIRSGSTLLRCLLNTHSRIRAPHELHIADLEVDATSCYVQLAMEVAGTSTRDLEHLLWDRIMHRELVRSGKDIFVDKTPGNLLVWPRLVECWPEARFIFLLRHPLRVVQSAIAGRPDRDPVESTELVMTYLAALTAARADLDGLSVRYEDLTGNPEQITREVCRFLGVGWEPEMLDYGRTDHGPFVYGIGDFTERIKAGRVLSGHITPSDDEIPDFLRPSCVSLGYLPTDA